MFCSSGKNKKGNPLHTKSSSLTILSLYSQHQQPSWYFRAPIRVAEVVRKVWTQTKILSPNIRYFVANWDLSRFTHFLEIFGQKKCLFGSKTVFLGQEVHYYMVYIAYFTELILQICDYAQKRCIWRKNCKYTLDENYHCHFCCRRKAAKFCHPAHLCKCLYISFHEMRSNHGLRICREFEKSGSNLLKNCLNFCKISHLLTRKKGGDVQTNRQT